MTDRPEKRGAEAFFKKLAAARERHSDPIRRLFQ